MEITKSIQRIAWRFSQGKAFLPNENDTDALNGIIAFYNQQQEQYNECVGAEISFVPRYAARPLHRFQRHNACIQRTEGNSKPRQRAGRNTSSGYAGIQH